MGSTTNQLVGSVNDAGCQIRLLCESDLPGTSQIRPTLRCTFISTDQSCRCVGRVKSNLWLLSFLSAIFLAVAAGVLIFGIPDLGLHPAFGRVAVIVGVVMISVNALFAGMQISAARRNEEVLVSEFARLAQGTW
jgi:hypothetical protein